MDSPLLVTGSHRCGSTWVGRMLALSPELEYVDEPFHVRHRPGRCRARVDTWYLYVTDENADAAGMGAALGDTLDLRYALGAELPALRTPRDAARMVRDQWRFHRARRRGAKVLMKDPLAFFSAPWIARKFGARVLVLTRHPAAFASSLLRLGWEFDFRNWLGQPLLVRDVLGPWEEELRSFRGGDVVDQAALIWKVIAGVTLDYMERFPDWLFLRHEDLSRDPKEGFRNLYHRLGLTFSASVERALSEGTRASNPAEAPQGKAHALRRDSRANMTNWKRRLTAEQIERVRAGVGGVADRFYGVEDW